MALSGADFLLDSGVIRLFFLLSGAVSQSDVYCYSWNVMNYSDLRERREERGERREERGERREERGEMREERGEMREEREEERKRGERREERGGP